MKKAVSKVLVIAMLATAALGLCSCGETHECDFCGEETKCKEKTMLDETVYVCDDCMDEIEDIQDMLD